MLNDEILLDVERTLTNSIKSGLHSKIGNSKQCFPSHVTKMPTGFEKGVYLVVDFGAPYLKIFVTEIEKST